MLLASVRTTVLILSLLLGGARVATAQSTHGAVPPRVLITNDNGIDDPKLVTLAREFAEHAETWVVAPASDRSGYGAHVTIVREGGVAVERHDLGPGIRAFAVSGSPADAVIVALRGIMRDSLPDLVVSGINGGPNIGGGWMFSGTVGAARVAALAGFPAIAVSGLLADEMAGAKEAAAEWVVRLSTTQLVRRLRPLEFLAVSFPPRTPVDVRGARITGRGPLLTIPRLTRSDGHWAVAGSDSTALPVPHTSDVAAWRKGFIAVVPMRADEVDHAKLERWRRPVPALPTWLFTRPEGG